MEWLRGRETIAVMGPALVRTRYHAKIGDTKVPEGEVYRFIFPPGVSHAIKNLSKQPNMLIAFNTVEHDPGNPDSIKDVLL
jgi:hypothetical protein